MKVYIDPTLSDRCDSCVDIYPAAFELNAERKSKKVKRFGLLVRLSIVVIVMLLLPLQVSALARQGEVFSRGPVQLLKPNAGVITIQQVTFDFDAGRATNTDWGQLQIDPVKWGKVTGMDSGYVNMFVYSQGRVDEVHWAVQNLFLPSLMVKNCPPTAGNKAGLTSGPSSARPDRRPAAVRLAKGSTPMSVSFDLRPGVEGSGPVDSIIVSIVVSKQALPVIEEIMDMAGNFRPIKVNVKPVTINAEGDLSEDETIPRTSGDGPDMVGPPPLPPDPGPGPIDDFAFPIAVYQANQRNMECAINQCVPMAHANTLQYLEDRYNSIPLVWRLPQLPIPGIGRSFSQGGGDIVFWEPIPENSLVANIDSRTKRSGVKDFETGNGTSRCQQIRGAFGYMAEFGNLAKVNFRHQGGSSPAYGDGTVCDDDELIDLGGLVTNNEGANPTWNWIFDQLKLGRGVAMSFGRYNNAGERTSGHMLRVWGAMRFDGKDYLYTLDDSEQGDNETGTRTEQWEVADTGGPGNPGNPDGRLNMNGTTWEIEFSISAEAMPTLVIP